MSLILIHANGNVQRQNGKDMETNKTKIKKLTKNIFTAEYNVYCKRSLPMYEILTIQFEFSFSGY